MLVVLVVVKMVGYMLLWLPSGGDGGCDSYRKDYICD